QGRGSGPQQRGGEVGGDAVHGAGGDERPGQGRAALQQHGPHAASVQGDEQGGDVQAASRGGARHPQHLGVSVQVGGGSVGQVGGDGDQGGGGVVQDPGAGFDGRGLGVGDDAQRLDGVGYVADGEVGVVGAGGSGADEDGVGLRAQPVDVRAGLGGGDP